MLTFFSYRQSVRRTVLRSAASASATVTRAATRPATTSFVRSIAAQQTAACRPASLAIAARYFSQTARVANSEDPTKEAGELTNTDADASAVANNNEGETPYGVFIRNMVFDASEDHLREAFEHYGTVTRVAIARDARGMSKGYGFVWFETEDAKTKALEEADGSFWHGRRIAVTHRVARQPRDTNQRTPRNDVSSAPKREPSKTLYIGNLPYETTDADLNVIFRELDGVIAVRVAVDRSTGWPRGFAHADFDTVEHAQAGAAHLLNKQVGSRNLRIDYADSEKRNNKTGASNKILPSESSDN